jgi:hypothetical protein
MSFFIKKNNVLMHENVSHYVKNIALLNTFF